MKHLILFPLSIFLLSTCHKHPSEKRSPDSPKVTADVKDLKPPLDFANNELSENSYSDWKADTLISNHGFALVVYHQDQSVDLNNLVGEWSQLKMDSLKGHHVLYHPCDSEIQTLTFRFIDDTLHMSEFLGQMSQDYSIDKIEANEDIKLTVGDRVFTINLDYALRPGQGRAWKYKHTCVVRWLDSWGESRTEIYAKESSLHQFDSLEETPCDH